MIKTSMKKIESHPRMTNHGECANTAYVPIAKATIIATMAIMVKLEAYINSLRFCTSLIMFQLTLIMKWVNIAEVEKSKYIVFFIILFL